MLTTDKINCTVDFERDGKQFGNLELSFSDNHNAFARIPVPVVNIKNGSGPTLLLTAGNHGDEYEGQVILRRLIHELSATDIQSLFGRRSRLAVVGVERLVAAGTCRRSRKGAEDYFVFPDLQPRLQSRFCDYCDAELPINLDADNCPNCGGVLSSRVAVRSVSEGELFSMDETSKDDAG